MQPENARTSDTNGSAAGRSVENTFDVYACPACATGSPLRLDDTGRSLGCTSGHSFPVDDGMPRFVQDEGYAGSFGLQWQEFRNTQVDSATGASITRDRFFSNTLWPSNMSGETILEAGCGSGRFTEVLISTGARIVSFDYSRAADVTHANFGGRGAVVCQASIYDMPYRRASFDRVFCYGVIQHCPDVKAAFMKLVDMVRPGGHLAVDVYDKRRMFFNARYRVRWATRRIKPDRLLAWCRAIVPKYMSIVPPLHPWNQLIVPIKDYRGSLPGLTREQEIEFSILDTMDMLSPAHDHPQFVRTMRRWSDEAGLVAVDVRRGGNGILVSARRPE